LHMASCHDPAPKRGTLRCTGSMAPALGRYAGTRGAACSEGRPASINGCRLPRLLRQSHGHAAVLSALAFDLCDGDRPDLGGVGDMGAATGLQVDLPVAGSDTDQPHPARTLGGLYGHGLDEAGIGVKLLGGDPCLGHVETPLDQGVHLALQHQLVIGRIGHGEIQTPLFRRDRPTGHRKRDHHRQEVQRRMHPHMAEAAIPVEALFDLGAHGRQGGGLRRNQNDVRPLPLHRHGNRDAPPIPVQHAAVAGLAAAPGIEQRRVQNDAALTGQARDLSGRRLAVHILQKQRLGHGSGSPSLLVAARRVSGLRSQTSRCAKGISMPSSVKRAAIAWFRSLFTLSRKFTSRRIARISKSRLSAPNP
jgi:hypothetical protein